MKIFEFYKYSIEKWQETPNLFKGKNESEDNPPPHYDSPLDCFSNFFKTGGQIPFAIRLSKTNDNSEWESYNNDVLRNENGIILLTLENNREKHTIEKKREVRHPHHPFCQILIDNRADHCYIAIERNSAFSCTNEVANLMMSAFNNSQLLGQYHLTFTMSRMMKEKAEFWSMVNDIQTLFRDVVSQICLDFNGKENKQFSPDGMAAFLMQLAHKAECATSFLIHSSDKDHGVQLEKIQEDLTYLADICMRQHGYDLSVRFKRFGVFKYGKDVYAQFGIDDRLLNGFECPSSTEMEINFEDSDHQVTLVSWLDRMHTILNEYKHEPIVSTKRSRSSRRKVRK